MKKYIKFGYTPKKIVCLLFHAGHHISVAEVTITCQSLIAIIVLIAIVLTDRNIR